LDKYIACISSRDVIETLVKKKIFYHSLMKKGVPHPKTLFPEELKDSTNIEDKVAFPVFVKPSVSQTFAMKFGRKGFVANSKEELDRYLRLMNKNQIDVMIQEIVAGPSTNHYFIDGYFDRNSRLIAVFARRRLRMYPLDFGNSTTCVSVPISEVVDMKETIAKYLASIGFRGIFSAEFKRDTRDNMGKLLEVNARSWWFNTYPSACGVNIILAAYLEAVGEVPENSGDYETGKYLVYLMEDLKCSIPMFIQRKLSFREWVSPMLGRRDWVIFAKDDLRPFAISIPQTLRDAVKQRRKIATITTKKN
jgi:predicted ATP-grasp superfamily ATP-dependent carboligase